MDLTDLEFGTILETRNGNKYLFHSYGVIYIAYNLCGEGFINLEYHYNDKMEHEEKSDLDIVKIYEDYTCQKVLWERDIELSPDEKALLRCLPKQYKFIARDESYALFVYENKPSHKNHQWQVEKMCLVTRLVAFEHLFRFIKWEDEEPYLIEDLLKAGD